MVRRSVAIAGYLQLQIRGWWCYTWPKVIKEYKEPLSVWDFYSLPRKEKKCSKPWRSGTPSVTQIGSLLMSWEKLALMETNVKRVSRSSHLCIQASFPQENSQNKQVDVLLERLFIERKIKKHWSYSCWHHQHHHTHCYCCFCFLLFFCHHQGVLWRLMLRSFSIASTSRHFGSFL